MEKQLKDYLHLYLGCHAMHGGNRVKVCGLNINSSCIQNILNHDTIPIDEIKLLLRPLSDMKEIEAEFVAQSALEGKATIYVNAEVTAYFLSKHFDLFGLIEAGLAIDSTTLKK